MKQILLSCALSLAIAPAFAQSPTHTFAIQGDHFTLDGKPFKVLSGELHYARIPREYWHARLKMAKAMGLNTIATYVFWNIHEPTPGHYDFTGNNDLVAFIKAAQEEGLYVILRTGPYSCAEWEFGGFPAWLLKDPRMHESLRTDDTAFMVPVERWIDRLAKEVAPLQIGRGGPILITQVENEFGSYRVPPNPDHTYMTHMRDIFLRAGFTSSMLDTVDGYKELPYGGVPGVYTGVNFGVGDSKKGLDALAAFQPGKPLMVTEYWPGWFDAWGHPHETRALQTQIDDLDYILSHGEGINLYMFHGGTSFGFMSGANLNDGHYLPQVTSYDYGAPLDESGRPTPKFFAFRKIFAKYACASNTPKANAAVTSSDKEAATTGNTARYKEVVILSERSESKDPRISSGSPQNSKADTESCLPPVPTVAPTIAIPKITFTESTTLWDNLPTPIPSEDPKPMEQYDQAYGYILYRTTIPASKSGAFNLGQPHDFALAYLDGHLRATYDRRIKNNFAFNIQFEKTPPGKAVQFDVLVANDDRVNFSAAMRNENKGLLDPVIGQNGPIKNWQVYTLPMTTLPTKFYPSAKASPYINPTFFRAHFTLAQTGDTFIDTSHLVKGALWINGHPIGRFWWVGPQQTLYVPAPWLRKGENEIIVFDLEPSTSTPSVVGLDHPILDGYTPDQSQKKQE